MCASGGSAPVYDSATGKISVLFTFEREPGSSGTTLWSVNSSDLGRSFSAPRLLPVPKPPRWCQVVTTGNPGLQLGDGTLLVPGYHTKPQDEQHNCSAPGNVIEWQHTYVSTDHGLSWAIAANASSAPQEYGDGTAEGAVVQLFDDPKHLLAAMRVDEAPKDCSGPQPAGSLGSANVTSCRMVAESCAPPLARILPNLVAGMHSGLRSSESAGNVVADRGWRPHLGV